MTFFKWVVSLVAVFCAGLGSAMASQSIPDQYPGSPLYQKPVEVIPNVWSAIGQTGPPTFENSGHNNNLSFIVTGDGVVVVNAGATNLLAKALHEEIKKVTDQPVKLVINENGQGHAMLGNGYWVDQGVTVLAHEDAATEIETHGADILFRMKQYNTSADGQSKVGDTRVQAPTETFSDEKTYDFGGTRIEVKNLGTAHSPGDIVVWLPAKKMVISGDVAFHERMLPIFDETDTAGWIETWAEFEKLGALYVIPGHGHPTNMAQVKRYTHDYLVYLRGKIGALIDEGKGLKEAFYVDQTPYKNLDTFDELATKNAGRVFQQMEFE